MALGNLALAVGLLGASDKITLPPNNSQVIPPIPTGTTTYSGNHPQLNILGMSSLGGGSLWPINVQGGLSAAPVDASGMVNIYAWWPNDLRPLLSRVQPDGSIVPVRGGYPIKPAKLTRNNYCQNPSIEAGINGFTAASGAPTLSQVTRTDIAPPNLALHAVIASAGSCGVKPPHVLPYSNITNFAFDLLISSNPSGSITVTVSYADRTGASAGSTIYTVPSAQTITYVGQYTRCVGSAAAPAGAAAITTVEIAVAGLPINGYIELDQIMFSGGDSDTSYADGDTLGGSWVGVAELSNSVIAPINTIYDAECPLDQPVRYIVANSAVIGGYVLSPLIMLNSNGTTWVSHPDFPGAPQKIWIKDADFDKVYTADQGIFNPIGAVRPIVVSSGQRHASTGTIVWGAFSYAERDAWLTWLNTLDPMFFRMPAAYGFGYGRWYSFGDVTEQSMGLGPQQDMRAFSAPFVEVDGPTPVSY